MNHRALPEIKLEPHEVDQFLNLSSKEGVSSSVDFLPYCGDGGKGISSVGNVLNL